MRDYRKHLTLLPHKWQAIALFAAGVLAVVYYYLLAYTIRSITPSETYRLYLLGIVHLPVSVALMIACLSKEKEEDEYITSVRYRALAITMFWFFVLRAILEMMYGSLHTFVFNRYFAGLDVIANIMGSSAFRTIRQIIGLLGSTDFTMLIYIILVKVLKRRGIENGNKSILLPNGYRKVGWYLFIISMVLIVSVVILNCKLGHSNSYKLYENHATLLRLMIIIPYIAMVFICLSKEKQEDEFIRLIRVRILIYFAIFYLVLGIVGGLSENLFQLYQFKTMNNRAYAAMIFLLIMRMLSWFPLLGTVYALVLRKVLSKNSIECNDEE